MYMICKIIRVILYKTLKSRICYNQSEIFFTSEFILLSNQC